MMADTQLIEKVVVIKSSEEKLSKSDKPYLDIHDQDDMRFSCWDESLWNSLGANASVKVGYEKKGIFKNIVVVEAMEKALAEVAIDSQPKDNPEKRKSSWRDEDRTDARTAAMEIGEDWRAGKLDDGNRLVLARKVWLLAALGVSEEEIKKAFKKEG